MIKRTTILWAILPCVLYSQAQGIDDVLKSIEKNNIELQAAQKDVASEVEEIKQSNTVEGLSVEYSPFMRSGIPGISSSELIVSQEFDFPTLYGARRLLAKKQHRVLNLEYQTKRRDLLLEAKIKCLDWIQLNQLKNVLADRLEKAQRLSELYQKRFEHGEATILELNKLKMEQMSLHADIAKNEAARQRVYQELLILNGNQPLLLEHLAYPLVTTKFNADSLRTHLLQTDAEVLAAKGYGEAAQQQLNVNKNSWLPRLTIGYRRNTEGDFISNGVQIGFALPLYTNQHKKKAAQAALEGALLRKANVQMKVTNEWRARQNELEQLRTSLSTYDLIFLRQSLQTLRKIVEIGEMSLLDYYTEVDKIYEKWQDYINIEHQFQLVYAELTKNSL
ncbi:TolC family protein [Hoylesella timonensis]|uniref:TolC family protein n=1 Tax=Hoylesella timonensis TaxID=386414 RepID=UPI0018CE0CAB|nr:TolC family protein [Hoylesella timonensis]